jgi:hypothetical protein
MLLRQQFGRGQHVYPSCGELNRQREVVQRVAYLFDSNHIAHAEVVALRPGTIGPIATRKGTKRGVRGGG